MADLIIDLVAKYIFLWLAIVPIMAWISVYIAKKNYIKFLLVMKILAIISSLTYLLTVYILLQKV